ncbi:MAG: NYN domain-containing protein [Peptococcaceae bacterium]|nr:NYN domain-containing protein [Peptococcaceae bacterium]
MVQTQTGVAVLLDLENLYWGLHNNYGVDFNPLQIMEIALQHGEVIYAKAFANLDEMPSNMKGRLDAAGFDTVHVPRERGKSYTDFEILVDIFQTVVDNINISKYILATGDGHFRKVIAKLRHRLHKDVIIVGIKGTINSSLYDAVGPDNVIELGPTTCGANGSKIDESLIAEEMVKYIHMVHDKFPALTFKNTVKHFATHITARKNGVPVPESSAHHALVKLINRQIVIQEEVPYNGTISRIIRLNYEHPFVIKLLQLQPDANASNHLNVDTSPVTDMNRQKHLKQNYIKYLSRAEQEYQFLTFLRTAQAFYHYSGNNGFSITENEARNMLSNLIREGLVKQELSKFNGSEVKTIKLNRSHPEVIELLGTEFTEKSSLGNI